MPCPAPLPRIHVQPAAAKPAEAVAPLANSSHCSSSSRSRAHQRAKRKRPRRPAPSLSTQLMAAAPSLLRLLETPREESRDLVVNTLLAPAVGEAGGMDEGRQRQRWEDTDRHAPQQPLSLHQWPPHLRPQPANRHLSRTAAAPLPPAHPSPRPCQRPPPKKYWKLRARM